LFTTVNNNLGSPSQVEDAIGNVTVYESDLFGRLVKGVNSDGDVSEYAYNGLGMRIGVTQTIQGANRQNYPYRDIGNAGGSYHVGSLDDIALREKSDAGQEVYTDNFGLTRQNETQEITRGYIPDYARDASNDLTVYQEGQHMTSIVYGLKGELSRKTEHYIGTHPVTGAAIDTSDTHKNVYTDNAVAVGVLYSHGTVLGSADYTTNADGDVRSWADYDVWGSPKAGVSHDLNLAVITDTASFTGYTYDAVLELYFAQFRFYDATARRFTSEDPLRSSRNCYAYAENDPVNWIDPWGLFMIGTQLQIGARGDDVGLLRDRLIQLGKYNIQTLQQDYNYFDSGLQIGVAAYYDGKLEEYNRLMQYVTILI
jgi:RHS repeat-associated protein